MKTKSKYLSKLVILFLMFASTVFSQSISNTLGIGGVFTIKDASSNFFTLSQSTGQVNILKSLRLENTTDPSIGIIFKGTERFLHDYGVANTFLGINSGNFTTTGSFNTVLGTNSLRFNTTGGFNTAVGLQSLFFNTQGYHNTAIGSNSLYSNTAGYWNTAVGSASLNSNTTGYENTALGYRSLYQNTIGNENTAVGHNSLYSTTSGYSNTALGNESLTSNTTGFNNTALGDDAGSTITTGHNLTCLGNNSEPSSGSANHEITLGNSSIEYLRCAVQTITTLSDVRDKKNIKDLSLGLDFLMKVKPRLFHWDKREWYENNISDGSKMKEAPTAGFIAQELDEVQTTENAEWLNLVLKDNPEKLEATSGNLLPVMVKAIQELKAENDLLKQNNEKLSTEVVSFKSMSEKLSAEVEAFKFVNEKLIKLEQMVNELNSVKHTSLNSGKVNFTNSKDGDVK